MSATAIVRALALASLMLPVKSFSDVAAAQMCLAHHLAYMVRIGPHDVLCLASAAGIGKRAVKAQTVIDAAVRQVRGK